MKIKVSIQDPFMGPVFEKFVKEMVDRLNDKCCEGFEGWDSESYGQEMYRRMILNAGEPDYVDVANLAMFLWNIKWDMPKKMEQGWPS